MLPFGPPDPSVEVFPFEQTTHRSAKVKREQVILDAEEENLLRQRSDLADRRRETAFFALGVHFDDGRA